MKDQIKELVGLLRQSEMKRKEAEKELKVREQAVATTLATPASVRFLLLREAIYANKAFDQGDRCWNFTLQYLNIKVLFQAVNILRNLDLGYDGFQSSRVDSSKNI